MRLHEFAERKVLPHERTLSGPKADRLNLFRKTRTNISSIFGLYADDEGEADRIVSAYTDANEPLVDAVFQGVRNRLWRIVDPVSWPVSSRRWFSGRSISPTAITVMKPV